MTYTFALVVDGVDASSEDHVETLGRHGEVVTVSASGGMVTIDLAVEAISAGSAVRTGIHVVERAVSSALVRRVDLDLVAATDIADRVGVSRQAVGQWVASPPADRPFPAPLGHVAGGTRVWAWSAVVPWLHERGHLTDEHTLDEHTIVEINALLLRPRQPGRLATSGEWRSAEVRPGGGRGTVEPRFRVTEFSGSLPRAIAEPVWAA